MRNPGDAEVEKPDRGLIGGGIGDGEIQAADFFPVMGLLVLGSG